VGYASITLDFAMYHDNGYNPSTGEGIQPQYSIDNGATWINAGAFINRYSATNGWVVHTISLPVNAGGIANLRIAFLFASQFGNNVFMDFAHINGTPTALPPTVTTNAATAILGTTATVNGTVNANGTSTTLLTEGWESATNNSNVPPAGWAIDILSGLNITYFMSSGTYPTVAPFEGARLVDFESYSYSTGYTNRLKRTTPVSTVGLSNITVDFEWYTDNGYSGDILEGVTVVWSTDGVTWNNSTFYQRYNATNQWVLETCVLPAGAAGQPTLYVGFSFYSQFGNDCHMDIMHVTGMAGATTVTFNYGLTVAYGTTVPGVPSPVTGNTNTAVSANLVGLTPSTLYHYRCSGTSASGTTNGGDLTFTTTAAPPTVVTTAATAISFNTATLNGTINPNGVSSTVSFDYGLTVAYGSNVAGTPSPVTGNAAVPVSANIAGLTPGTLYHFRVKGVSVGGTSNGSDLTFTTTAQPPVVNTLAATGVGGTSATLQGNVNPSNAPTTTFFDYGLTIPYSSNNIPAVPASLSGNTTQAISLALTGLTNNSVYHYRAKGTNVGGTTTGNDMTFVLGCPVAGAAGAITGPGQACQGGTGYVYSVAPIIGATGYNWTVPVGGTIMVGANTNSITVNYSPTAVSGYVFVYGTAPCGNGSPNQLSVTLNTAATPTLIGPANACITSTGNVYTTQAGMTNYVWTVSAGGTPTAGGTATSNTITVTWNTAGAQTVSVNYTNAAGCPALSPTVYNVTVNPLPVPTVAGPNPACTNIPGVTYSTQAGMINYVWSVSAGGTIQGSATTNTITVLWTVAGAQTVSVSYTNANGCTPAAPTVYPVTVNPTTVPVINGTNNLCLNSGYYNYTTQPGMINYIWTVSSGGTITNGQGTSTLQVVWTGIGAQTVSVIFTNGSNLCTAATPTVFPVTVSGLPDAAGTITGTPTACAGATAVAYSVPTINNSITYVWTLPAGATIASGSGTNSITVDYANNASSGNITVYGNSICGNGATSPPYAVTITQLPGTASDVTGPASVCFGEAGVVYSILPLAGATSYTWTVPSGFNIIAGIGTNSITVDIDPAAIPGNIKVFGSNSCGDGGSSPTLAVTVNPVPPAPVIQEITPGVLSSDALAGNQWYVDGTLIGGANAQTYTATQTGHYTDIVTLAGCSSAPSNDIYIIMVGISESAYGSSVNVYPNPGDGLFTLVVSVKETQSFDLTVINNLGITIYEQKDLNIKGTLTTTLDLRSKPEGVYTILLKNDRTQITRKIVIDK
jgi:hypothetical protein